MTYAYLAFFTGIFGSFHCVAMCGPLLAAMPYVGHSAWKVLFQIIIYQIGRILMYGLLGMAAGFIGSGFNFIGLQQTLSAVTGIALILIGLSHFGTIKMAKPTIGSTMFYRTIVRLLGQYINKPLGGFAAGAINGLLPCGIIYIALGQAINLPEAWQASEFMLIFGLGTTPLLLITAMFPVVFRKTRLYMGFLPILFLLSGSILLARGLNVNIPYVWHHIDPKEGILDCK